MKIAAAYAIAIVIEEDHLSEDYIIPGVFNENVHKNVAKAVAEAAIRSGLATRQML
jgi:malate dehydrogenase (oxaloacetate-decarboxylating)